MFQRAAGISMIHVPYKGIPPAVTDVIGGRVTMLFTTTISAAPHIKAGKLRAVALTSAKRQSSMPDVPTVGETLPGSVQKHSREWSPPRRPRHRQQAVGEVARIGIAGCGPALPAHGAEAVGAREEFAAFLKTEMQKWSQVQDAGINQKRESAR